MSVNTTPDKSGLKMVTFGIDEIDGGEAITEFSAKDIEESATWGGPVRYWSQFFDYTVTEFRSDRNHLAMQCRGPKPEVCKRLVRVYFDAAAQIDAAISDEAIRKHNEENPE